MKTKITLLTFLLLFSFCLKSSPFFEKDLLFNENDSNCTFLKSIGENGIDEDVFAIVESPSGGFVIGGRRSNNSLLLHLSDEGDILWQKEINFLQGEDEIYDLMIDSEGYLIGNSRLEGNGANSTAIFKYDYLNDILIWVKEFTNPNESRFEGMVEKPNGNYIFYGRVQPVNSCDATLMEIDKDTGDLNYIKGFHLDHCEIIIGAAIYDDHIFAVGRYSIDGIGVARFRASLTKFDLDGNEIWSRLYTTGPNPTARTYMSHILVVDDKILMGGRGDLSGTEFNDVPIFYYEIDPETGTFNWSKYYEISNSNFQRPSQMIQLSDGFLFPGLYNESGTRDYFLMKVDTEGNIIWQNGYELGSDQSTFTNFHVKEDYIYFTGKTINPNGADTDIIFGRLNLDGTLENNQCDIVTPIDIVATDYSNSYQGNVSLDDFNLNIDLPNTNPNPQNLQLINDKICN